MNVRRQLQLIQEEPERECIKMAPLLSLLWSCARAVWGLLLLKAGLGRRNVLGGGTKELALW